MASSATRRRATLLVILAVGLLALAAPAQGAFPGGRWGKIAFESNVDGNHDIYTVNPDGSGLTRLTNDPADDVSPAWTADGRYLAFARNVYPDQLNL